MSNYQRLAEMGRELIDLRHKLSQTDDEDDREKLEDEIFDLESEIEILEEELDDREKDRYGDDDETW